ncbi:repressor of the inhibitor of the protein kinase [Araneus ventricosus]|uniref:Repressor of the inhibitor of the protein kinase n=1 Tax=Araneus ventricosus TaxID=182803 RepID=A0A4Y2HZQ8_ARAVE|nr:repressor of the inhibitor of the protein kinase [Araneus ventricosus]
MILWAAAQLAHWIRQPCGLSSLLIELVNFLNSCVFAIICTLLFCNLKALLSIHNEETSFYSKLFAKSVNRPVSDSAEVGYASNNASSGVANTNTVDPARVALDFNQQIAIKGHRDGGRIGLEEPEKNDGNFRSLLRYKADSGDNDLKDHSMNSGGRNMNTSSFIQNELINTFGHLIESQIVTNVRKSIFYSVLADETTDISQIEQFSLCVRYIEDQSYKIREDVLTFVPVYDVIGAGLANTVLETLSSLVLDLKKMRGQGYDGAATMRGQFRGLQASIKEKLPLDLYTHCSSHSLNFCLSGASNFPSIRNCMGVIKEVCRFFHISAKRTEILKSTISDCCPEQKKKLISLCETRWVERHDSAPLFKDILKPILLSFENRRRIT